MSNHLVKAIRQFKPTAEFSFTDDDYSTIKWDVLEGTAPTLDEINSAIEKIKIEEAQFEANRVATRQALLERLGITSDEAKLLLG